MLTFLKIAKVINSDHGIESLPQTQIFLSLYIYLESEAEFKEFEPRLKYGWFHLKLYSIFQDLSRRLIETGFWGI